MRAEYEADAVAGRYEALYERCVGRGRRAQPHAPFGIDEPSDAARPSAGAQPTHA